MLESAKIALIQTTTISERLTDNVGTNAEQEIDLLLQPFLALEATMLVMTEI
jgi:hypothetical protein